MLLSKSDFKVARTCPTKLYYRKLGYRSVNEDNPYLQFLADGGYMVEAIARVRYPEGVEVAGDSPEERFAQTKRALRKENVTLFHATLIYDQLIAEVDILEKLGNRLKLIEVKAKSYSPLKGSSPFRGARHKIDSKWKPYLEDLAFQIHILASLYPKAKVVPYLCVVDKTQTATSDTVFENFQIQPRDASKKGFSKPQITFTGKVDALKKEPFVRILDASSEVSELLPVVKAEAARFAASIAGKKPVRIQPELGIICKDCEYRTKADHKNGFRECWGQLADPSPHILDLYYVNNLKPKIIPGLLAKGKAGLLDLAPSHFTGKRGDRQKLQLKWSRKNRQFIDPKLREKLAACKYPLHFLDFEASRMAVPYHAGMHPYGQVAFQWSCHTIREPGAAEIEHAEWINLEDRYPNFDFGRSLKEVVTGEGTVFVWSPFEWQALKDIRNQMATRSERDPKLLEWLQRMIDKDGPLVDLCELAREHYFHPDMGGSVSIKKVLPAVWSGNAELRSHEWFKDYVKEKDGHVLDPYKTLPSLAFEVGDEEEDLEAVREGTAAIRTYQELMFGEKRTNEKYRNAMRKSLLNYCKLDTAAMVMIWMHWTGLHKKTKLSVGKGQYRPR